MEVGQIVLAVMAIGAVAGGLDLLLGNRMGLGAVSYTHLTLPTKA